LFIFSIKGVDAKPSENVLKEISTNTPRLTVINTLKRFVSIGVQSDEMPLKEKVTNTIDKATQSDAKELAEIGTQSDESLASSFFNPLMLNQIKHYSSSIKHFQECIDISLRNDKDKDEAAEKE
jgi:hypothetical protein